MLLKRAESFAVRPLAEADAQRSGLADDAAPERVVEIQHKDFLRAGEHGPDAGPQVFGQPHGACFAKRLLRPKIAAMVVEALPAHHARDLFEVGEVRRRGQGLAQRIVDAPHEGHMAVRPGAEAMAQRTGGDPVITDLKNPCPELFTDELPRLLPECALVAHSIGGRAVFALGHEPLTPRQQDDNVRLAFRRIGGQQFLHDVVVGPLRHRQGRPLATGNRRQGVGEPGSRALAQKKDSRRRPIRRAGQERVDDPPGLLDAFGVEFLPAQGIPEQLKRFGGPRLFAEVGYLFEAGLLRHANLTT